MSEGRRMKRSERNGFLNTIARKRRKSVKMPKRRSNGAKKRNGWRRRRNGRGRGNCESGSQS